VRVFSLVSVELEVEVEVGNASVVLATELGVVYRYQMV